MPDGSSNDTQRTEDVAELHEQIQALRMQLAEAQKLTALGELVGTTTHEFNNILMTILNYAKLGLRRKDVAMREKALTKILAAAQRAAKITNSVLGLARNRSDSLEPTDLPKIIDDALVLLELEMAKYRVAIERQWDDVPLVLANGNQIQQVLLNLLVNARQAMPRGGQILIRLRRNDATNSVDMVIRDSGAGIEPEKLRRIFEPFFSTKKGPDATGKGGAGLGLAACRDIIDAHHGRILVQSTVGKGTAFTIRLPVVPLKKPAPLSPMTTTASTPQTV